MAHKLKKLEGSEVELTITVAPEEYEKHKEKAAQRISDKKALKGFRKGKAPTEMIKKEFGEMTIIQEALEDIIRDTFYQAVKEEKLETIGMPKIDIEKLAPGNEIVYKAVVGIMPKIKLADISKIKVQKKEKPVDEKKVEETLDALRGMSAKEVIKTGPATGTDKLVLDMQMFLDKVPVEGGQSKDHQVYLSENHYIPGFNEQVAGLKKDDEKEFSLSFPESHYQKMLAGKTVDFKVKVKDVYERQLPEMTDEMAKTLGQENVTQLRKLIKENLEKEAAHKAEQAAEIEMLEAMIEKTEFEPIPQVIVDSERQKMFYELKNDLDKNNITTEQYLADVKKTEKELFEDFKAQAEKRAKAALISRQVAIEQGIKISKEELEKELDTMREVYKKEKETLERLDDAGVQESIATAMQNKKVIQWLKEQMIK